MNARAFVREILMSGCESNPQYMTNRLKAFAERLHEKAEIAPGSLYAGDLVADITSQHWSNELVVSWADTINHLSVSIELEAAKREIITLRQELASLKARQSGRIGWGHA